MDWIGRIVDEQVDVVHSMCPAAEFQITQLLVVGKVLNVDLNRRGIALKRLSSA